MENKTNTKLILLHMKRIALLIVTNLFAFNLFSQINIGDLFQAGTADAEALAQPYFQPYGEMLGVGLKSGWYTSAKVHATLGFDITFAGVYIMAPSSAETYDVNNVQLQKLELADGDNHIAPTIIGSKKDVPELMFKDDPTKTNISLPNGTGDNTVVLPMVTVGVGLPKGFEVKARLLPSTKLGGDVGEVSLWGFGVQKDIKDIIPIVKKLPILNVSVLAAYTDLSGSANVDDGSSLLENGKMNLDASAFTARLLVGANIPIISFYAGMGYGRTSSDFKIDGDSYNDEEVSAIKLDYSDNSFDFNVGARLRLGIFGIYGDYTVGKYSSFIGGVGISFR